MGPQAARTTYLFSVHAQVGCSSRHRDARFGQFDEVFLNSTRHLQHFLEQNGLITEEKMLFYY